MDGPPAGRTAHKKSPPLGNNHSQLTLFCIARRTSFSAPQPQPFFAALLLLLRLSLCSVGWSGWSNSLKLGPFQLVELSQMALLLLLLLGKDGNRVASGAATAADDITWMESREENILLIFRRRGQRVTGTAKTANYGDMLLPLLE